MLTRKRQRRGDGGQAMVEFCLVFPILFLLFMTVIQVALLMSARHVVKYAAFSGARAAAVGIDEEKVKKAAALACISISPWMNLTEFTSYASYLITRMPLDIVTIANDNAEYAGILELFDPEVAERIPGWELRNNLSSAATTVTDATLLLALEAVDVYVNGSVRGEVPSRYIASRLLTVTSKEEVRDGKDVTVTVTHYYAMRVPVINRIFYFMYLNFILDEQIRKSMNGFPTAAVDAVVEGTYQGMVKLTDASDALPLYLMPIREKSTLTIEREETTKPCCD